jgi:hypothetical protein
VAEVEARGDGESQEHEKVGDLARDGERGAHRVEDSNSPGAS